MVRLLKQFIQEKNEPLWYEFYRYVCIVAGCATSLPNIIARTKQNKQPLMQHKVKNENKTDSGKARQKKREEFHVFVQP